MFYNLWLWGYCLPTRIPWATGFLKHWACFMVLVSGWRNFLSQDFYLCQPWGSSNMPPRSVHSRQVHGQDFYLSPGEAKQAKREVGCLAHLAPLSLAEIMSRNVFKTESLPKTRRLIIQNSPDYKRETPVMPRPREISDTARQSSGASIEIQKC